MSSNNGGRRGPGARLGPLAFELYLLCVAVLIAVLGIATPDARSRSIVAAFPGEMQYIWYSGLLAGALMSLFGILRGPRGIAIEFSGLIILTSLSLSFSIAAIAYGGLAASSGALMFTGFSAACAVRAHTIYLIIARARAEFRARPGRK